jgi:hypothetical protein
MEAPKGRKAVSKWDLFGQFRKKEINRLNLDLRNTEYIPDNEERSARQRELKEQLHAEALLCDDFRVSWISSREKPEALIAEPPSHTEAVLIRYKKVLKDQAEHVPRWIQRRNELMSLRQHRPERWNNRKRDSLVDVLSRIQEYKHMLAFVAKHESPYKENGQN